MEYDDGDKEYKIEFARIRLIESVSKEKEHHSDEHDHDKHSSRNGQNGQNGHKIDPKNMPKKEDPKSVEIRKVEPSKALGVKAPSVQPAVTVTNGRSQINKVESSDDGSGEDEMKLINVRSPAAGKIYLFLFLFFVSTVFIIFNNFFLTFLLILRNYCYYLHHLFISLFIY